jgi:hypothetical protein
MGDPTTSDVEIPPIESDPETDGAMLAFICTRLPDDPANDAAFQRGYINSFATYFAVAPSNTELEEMERVWEAVTDGLVAMAEIGKRWRERLPKA